jgi:hypothetical protein
MPQTSKQRAILAGSLAAVVLIAVLVALFLLSSRGNNGAALDPGLRRIAARVAPILNRPGGKLPVTDASLKSFQAWVYNTEAKSTTVSHLHLAPRFVQVQLNDPSVTPPQALLIRAPGHPAVVVDSKLLLSVMQHARPAATTVQQAGRTYRVYIEPLHPPDALLQAQVSGVIEVLQAA